MNASELARTETRPLFSVIVPVLNEARRLPACLESLRAQTLPRDQVEWLFVDNGSTDESVAILKACDGVRLLSEPRQDPYLARNAGISIARGRYLAFLDADCVADPGWLDVLRREFERGQPWVLVGYLAYPSGAGRLLRLFEAYEDFKLKRVFDQRLVKFLYGHAGNMAVQAQAFEELGLFPPMPIVGDSEILHRVARHRPGVAMRYAREARVTHAEVDRFRRCLVKAFEAGAHSESLIRVSPYLPLPFRERWRVFRECSHALKFGLIQQLLLLWALLLGWLAFAAGRTSRRIEVAGANTASGQKRGEESL